MNNKEEKYLNSINDITLTQAERDSMRHKLRSFVIAYQPPLRTWNAVWNFISSHALASIFVIVLLLAGSTSTLAQGAVPGDFLYPLKLEFNDKIRSVVAISDDAKLDVELDQIARQLDDEEKSFANLQKDFETEDDYNDDRQEDISKSKNDFNDEESELKSLENDLMREESMMLEL